MIQSSGEQLIAWSYEQVRRARRTAFRSPVQPSAIPPAETEATIRAEFAETLRRAERGAKMTGPEHYRATAAATMLDLCAAVAKESGDQAGLAAQIASVDITALHAASGQLAELFSAAVIAALEADHAPTASTQSGFRRLTER